MSDEPAVLPEPVTPVVPEEPVVPADPVAEDADAVAKAALAKDPGMAAVHVPGALEIDEWKKKADATDALMGKVTPAGIATATVADLSDEQLAELHAALHRWAPDAAQADAQTLVAHQVVLAAMQTRNLPPMADDPLTVATRAALAKQSAFPACLPAELVVMPAVVMCKGDGNGTGPREFALRGKRAGTSFLVNTRSLWQPITKAARDAGADAALVGEITDGQPLYDLVLRRRDVSALERGTAQMPGSRLPLRIAGDASALRVLKADNVQQKVTGIVFEPDTVDTQDDLVAADEIERACHDFLESYRLRETKLRLAHDRDLSDTEAMLVENYITPIAMSIGGQAVKQGAWVQTWHLKTMALWHAAQDGTLTGFSFGGFGRRTAVAKSRPASIPETTRFVVRHGADGRIKQVAGPGITLTPVREAGELTHIDVERV